MKKLLSLSIVLILCLSLAACAKPENTSNEITELFDKGLSCIMSTATEERWLGVFSTEDNSQSFLAEANLTKAKYKKLNKIEFDDENALKALLGTLSGAKVKDISDKIPSRSELDKFTGLTLGEFENMGFENSGWYGDGEDLRFFYDGPVYACTVSLEEVIKDMNDYSVNALRKLTIKNVEFSGFSYMFLDNL